MARPPNPDALNRVRSWETNGYHYAYVYRYEKDDKNKDKRVRKKIYIGALDEKLVMKPNDSLRLMGVGGRRQLVFPDAWDISAFARLDGSSQAEKTMPSDNGNGTGNDAINGIDGNRATNDGIAGGSPGGESTHPLSAEERFPLYNNKIYGDFWLCEEVLKAKGVHDDLLATFNHDLVMFDDITTLAIYPLLSRKSYNMVASWQKYHHTPSLHPLESDYITRLSQKICDGDRLEFSRLRIARQPPGAYGCVDSTTRSGYTSPTHVVNVRFGHNKDGVNLACTSDVVVYSLATHEPVYIKSFPGNQSDMTTVRTVLEELSLLGITDIILITDRGYCSLENIGSFIREKIPFLTAAKVEQKPVFDCLSQVQYDEFGIPCNMAYDEETWIYCLQVGIDPFDIPLPDGTRVKAEGIKANLYLDIHSRTTELNNLKLAIDAENAEINKINGGECAMPSAKDFNKRFRWFRAITQKQKTEVDGIERTIETTQVLVHKDARRKAAAMAGFFSSLQWDIENSAVQSLHDYRLRDEQEKYFYGLKDVVGSDTQDVWTEGSRLGRDFIYLVGLVVYSHIKYVWHTTPDLKKEYGSTELLVDSMAPIRYAEYPNGVTHMTSFNSKQVAICAAFKISPPAECMTENQKEEYRRTTSPRPRGRPKGSKNKPKI